MPPLSSKHPVKQKKLKQLGTFESTSDASIALPTSKSANNILKISGQPEVFESIVSGPTEKD